MIALWAALAMVVQDILAVCMTQAEARNRRSMAGALDVIAWLAAIATTSISVSTLQGHNTTEKVLVLVSVSLANFVGSYSGTAIGERFIKPMPDPEVGLLIAKGIITEDEWSAAIASKRSRHRRRLPPHREAAP